MAFILPEANTHPDVAKEQHLVPRTYMRMWSYKQGDSVWVVDKKNLARGIESKKVDSINYRTGFHDIKAGDVFVPDEALNDLFGFMQDFRVECDGVSYNSLREFNDHFYEFEKWNIYNANGECATKKEKNEIKRIINQSRYTFIETEWCYQFEDNWQSFISDLEMKLRCKVLSKPYRVTEEERRRLFEYILIYDFRNIHGNAWINEIIDIVFPEEMAEVEIPKNERVHLFNETIGDEVKYEVRIRAFYEYLKNRNGKIAMFFDGYTKNLGIKFCMTTDDFPFITCESPSMVINRIDGLKEHIFIATPTLLITTFKTDNTNRFLKKELSRKEVKRYNKYIAQKADMLITNQEKLDYHKLLL